VSYGDFTVKTVIDLLGYQVEDCAFLSSLGFTPEAPSDKLIGALELLRMAVVISSEKSRAESLVVPILSEAAVKSHVRLFSGESFDVDAKSGLTGVVDYVFAHKAPGATIVRPVLCVVEAKRAEIDTRALGQCIATMIAAQRTNNDDEPVYGCVTTGSEWQFLRLSGKRADVEETLHYENELPVLLGILHAFLRRAEVATSSG
jgi:hypothetical protein